MTSERVIIRFKEKDGGYVWIMYDREYKKQGIESRVYSSMSNAIQGIKAIKRMFDLVSFSDLELSMRVKK